MCDYCMTTDDNQYSIDFKVEDSGYEFCRFSISDSTDDLVIDFVYEYDSGELWSSFYYQSFERPGDTYIKYIGVDRMDYKCYGTKRFHNGGLIKIDMSAIIPFLEECRAEMLLD